MSQRRGHFYNILLLFYLQKENLLYTVDKTDRTHLHSELVARNRPVYL